jgi:ABC-type uncharacterized transport system ATPase subunit
VNAPSLQQKAKQYKRQKIKYTLHLRNTLRRANDRRRQATIASTGDKQYQECAKEQKKDEQSFP